MRILGIPAIGLSLALAACASLAPGQTADKPDLATVLASESAGAGGIAAGAAPESTVGQENEKNPHVWKTRTTSVAVFKNGLGFFMREGNVDLREGWCLSDQVPPASFGTFAIYSHNEGEIVDIVGSGPGETVDFDGADAPQDLASRIARLEALKRLQVQLFYKQYGTERSASGKLVSVSSEFVVLESDANSFAVPTAGIWRLQVLNLPLRVHVQSEDGKSPATSKLGMAYLRKGLVWIPEYTLRVIDEKTAELTLRGTLVNEAEDLIHCDVNFVVGVPHFIHTDHLTPIAVGQVIRTIGASIAPGQVQSQIMNRASFANSANGQSQFDLGTGVVDQPVPPAGGDLSTALGNLPQIDGPGASDYTVYTKKDLTVRMGEKAIVTLFTKRITYSHIYRWGPPAAMQHSLVLHNDTDTAWTTGPCLAVSGDRPLSEDLLKYTPRKGRGELPVTDAVNVAHDRQEIEIDRKLKAHTPADQVYLDLVTLEGKLQLKNFEPRAVEILITVEVPGKPVLASDEGQLQTDSSLLRLLERKGTVSWRVKLEPGETKTLDYKYERYVPSN